MTDPTDQWGWNNRKPIQSTDPEQELGLFREAGAPSTSTTTPRSGLPRSSERATPPPPGRSASVSSVRTARLDTMSITTATRGPARRTSSKGSGSASGSDKSDDDDEESPSRLPSIAPIDFGRPSRLTLPDSVTMGENMDAAAQALRTIIRLLRHPAPDDFSVTSTDFPEAVVELGRTLQQTGFGNVEAVDHNNEIHSVGVFFHYFFAGHESGTCGPRIPERTDEEMATPAPSTPPSPPGPLQEADTPSQADITPAPPQPAVSAPPAQAGVEADVAMAEPKPKRQCRRKGKGKETEVTSSVPAVESAGNK